MSRVWQLEIRPIQTAFIGRRLALQAVRFSGLHVINGVLHLLLGKVALINHDPADDGI